jgi:hypothetical protein
MKLKWVIGKKMNYFLACLWASLSVINFIQGHWIIGCLEVLLTLMSIKDGLNCKEESTVDIEISTKVVK